MLAVALCGTPVLSVLAQGLNATELLPEVEQCSLKLTGERPPMDPEADALVLKVGSGTVGAGITSHLFYFAPGKDGRPDDFGLLLDAPVEIVAKALPDYAEEQELHGYRRQLTTIGDPDGSGQGEQKSLLVCRAGPRI